MSAKESVLSVEDVELPEDFDESQFEDPDDFVDEISDEELLADILAGQPELDLSTDAIIVVDNVPKVNSDRLPKLENVLNKVFSKFGTIVSHYHPKDESGTTKGYFFLEFANSEQAEQAVKAGNGYRLDKSHIFVVNHFSDFEKYENVPEDWEPPKENEYLEVGDLQSWLLDQSANDQFAVIFGGGTKQAIAYNSTKGPKLVVEREGWSDMYLRWSPRGSYLATFHLPKGIAVWGAEDFKRIQRFLHPGAQMVDFSPCENYIISFSRSNLDDPESVIVWDTRTGAKKRGFSASDATDWPVLKWSHDGKYFARKSKDLLSVYETPSFGLLDKRSLVFKGINDYQWSPTEHFVAYWVPEQGANPAKVALIQLPSRMEIRSKNLFQVSECHLRWQKGGDYLVVRVDRWATKSKKQLTYSLEVFHVRKPDIPVDTIEVKEPVITFAVEPHGDKLAVLYGISPRIKLNLYGIKIIKGATPDLLQTVNTRLMNHLSWSPRGQCLVLAAIKSAQTAEGYLEFYDTGEPSSPTCHLMSSPDHADMTDLEWDPTGRYVTTSTSYWSNKRDTGFTVWSFQGKLLYKHPVIMDKFCQFLWRPRPPSLLTEEDMQRLKKNLKKYYQQFDAQDRINLQLASQDLIDKRKKLMKEFKEFRTKSQQAFKNKCKKFPQYAMEVEDEEVSEEEISVLVSMEETIVPED